MKKSIIIFMLVLSVIMPSQVRAQYDFNALPLYDSEEMVTFIVEMEDNPVLPEFNLSPKTKGDVKSGSEQKYRNVLLRSHRVATDAISQELSEDIKPKYTYTELFNGFAIEAKYGDLEAIKNTEGVKAVYVSSNRKADLRMDNAPSMTHSLPLETFGYTGSGQVIAVVDTEFDVKHVAFSKVPQNIRYTKDDIASVLSGVKFNASNDINRVYESDKIPFRFDYGEGDSDTYATSGVHGTHVAGIAAGNSPKGDFKGVAPDAQLVLMKIANAEGVIADAAMVAALDDAAKLDVSVINCSFGYNYQAKEECNPAVAACFENAYKSGIFVSAAAGNEGRGYMGRPSETLNIDDSATGNPNGFVTSLSVGSVDNNLGHHIYSDITLGDGSVIEVTPLYNDSPCIPTGEYVYCNLGYSEDFEGVDLKGKIAVVDRGVIPFAEKADNAKAAGATGMILINYDDVYLLTEVLSIPSACVKSSDGDVFKNSEVKTITSVTPYVEIPVKKDLTVSFFSSYGTTESLGLKPDVTAPGGGIYSSLPGDKYGYSDGTSMAAPHVSGIVAIISQYLEDTGCTATLSDRIELIGNMIMSTADVVYIPSEDEENKVPFSPRVQGAGLINTANAIKTPVILYADNRKTKIEFGDNLTDTLKIEFTAQNLTENDVVYDKISAVVLTDGYETENGKNYISGTKLLKSELITDFDTVVVPANSSVTVSAQLKLNSDELNENLLVFSNGFHIDGFVRLENTTEDVVSVGMPFMGFYGNWTQAPVFDTTMYDEGGSRLINSQDEYQGTVLLSNYGDGVVVLGYNSISDTYNADEISLSPNQDGYYDVLALHIVPMRSIKDLKFLVTDKDGNVLSTNDLGIVSKYKSKKGVMGIPDDLADGEYFATLEGYMNYESENSLKHSISIPFKVDRQGPLVKGCKLEDNVLSMDIYDFSGMRYISLTDVVTGDQYEMNYDSYVADDHITCTFEDNEDRDLSNIRVDIIDNAMNVASYFLGGFSGRIGANISEFSGDEEFYSITFELYGDEEIPDASLILAFYDENDNLLHTDIMKNQTLSSGKYEFSGDFDASTADKFKLFIWDDTENLKPLDEVKVFDMKMYNKSN